MRLHPKPVMQISSLLSTVTLMWLPMVCTHPLIFNQTSVFKMSPFACLQVLYSLRVLPCTPLVPWLSFLLVAPTVDCPSPIQSAAAALAVIVIAGVMLLLPVAVFAAMLKEFVSESQGGTAFRIR
jgi:hypothetical protein